MHSIAEKVYVNPAGGLQLWQIIHSCLGRSCNLVFMLGKFSIVINQGGFVGGNRGMEKIFSCRNPKKQYEIHMGFI